VRNNIWQSCVYNPGMDCAVNDHNLLNTGGASFVNATAGNFHLAANTTAGVNLGSPYNIDPDGNTRTTWSLGAYEYGSTSTNAPSTALVPIVAWNVWQIASLQVQAQGSASGVTNLFFNFGDGSYTNFGNTNAASTPHTYASPGTYTATLIASNNVLGSSISCPQVITVTQ